MTSISIIDIKEEVFLQCLKYVQQRIDTAKMAIASIESASESETKSSAGDKFETSREMMKQEMDRNQQLLFDAQQMLHTLNNLSSETVQPDKIGAGSLVQTDQSLFYLAVSAGKLTVRGKEVLALSPLAPVGRLLMNKQVGDTITFNGHKYLIQEIV